MGHWGSENYNFIRFFHWIFAVSVILLLFSGFHMSQPRVEALWPLDRTRNLHLVSASILVLSLAGRIYYSIFHRSFNNYIVKKRDIRVIGPYLKYLFFINSQPRSLLPRYDIAQKIIFLSWILAAVIQAATGTILLFPEELRLLANSIGNLQTYRSVHYFTSLWFIISVPLHIYLSITEEPARVQALLGIERNQKFLHGENIIIRLLRKVRHMYHFLSVWIESIKSKQK